MADVGLDADLVLDIRQAQEQVRRIERALDQATTGVTVRVTADTRGLAGEVTTAVDAADSTVTVTGEATDLTGDVTAAIDAADTTATVTGDASQLTGAVTTAVDEGDSTVVVTGDASQLTGAVTSAVDAGDTDVIITADASGLKEATGAADNLNTALIASSRSGLQLRTVLQAGLGGSAVAGIGALINAASDLEQAVGGTRAVFGEAQGAVVEFSRGAAQAAGLSEEAARRLTSQIGGLLKGFQFTQEEAADTSIVLAQLGADLAATFGGNPEEAVQALGAALRGEFDPLERFGVSLNITQANLKAVELGLADSTSEVSLNARAQASLALIMERSADAQGQFGREANTAAGQLERAKAEATNAAAAIGASLLPAFVDMLTTIRGSVLPTVQELGETLGPVLGRVLQAGAPLIEGFGAGLQALVPIAQAFATVLEAIPEPVLRIVGTFLALRAAAGPLEGLVRAAGNALANLIVPSSAVAGITAEVGKGTTVAATGFRGMLGSINPVTAALAAAAIGFTLYSQQQAEAAEKQRKLEAQTKAMREALQSSDGAVAGLTAQLRDLITSGEQVQVTLGGFVQTGVEADRIFRLAGISAQQFARALADTERPLEDVLAQIAEGGERAAFGADFLRQLGAEYQTQAKSALDAGVATEDWSESQVRAAEQANRNRDGTVNYVAALEDVQTASADAAAAEEQQTQALTEQQKAVQDLLASQPALAAQFTALQDANNRSAASLGAFAVAAADAGINGEQLAALLTELGGGGPQSAAALQAVADTIIGLRDAAAGTLPTLSEIAGAADAFTLQGFRDELANALTAVTDFNSNLVLIAEQGTPRLAAAAAQLGPQYAATIAQGIRDGNPEVIAELETLLAGLEQAGVDTSSLVTGTIGPQLAVATGQMGTAAAAAFGQSYVLDASGAIVAVEGQVTGGAPGVAFRNQEMGTAGAQGFESTYTPNAQPGIDSATGQISSGAAAVEGASKNVGTVSKAGFEGSFTPNPGPAIAAARGIIEAGAAVTAQAGFQLGDQAVRGFQAGTGRIGGAASAAASAAVSGLSGARGDAYAEGFTIGSLLASGIANGIRGSSGVVAAAAAAAVNSAAAAARSAARIASPSKLFTEIGVQMGEGMAVGLDTSSTAVKAAADALAVSAAKSAAAASSLSAPLPIVAIAASGGGAGAASPGTGGITVTVQSGAVVIQGSSAPARDIERAAGQLGTQIAKQVKFIARTGG